MAQVLALILLASLLACGEPAPSGLGEPLRVVGGAFKHGALPGKPPSDAANETITPRVTAIDSLPPVIVPSLEAAVLSGRTSTDAYSIALRFAKLGGGYWVLPVGAPDPLNQGELTWSATTDFGGDIEPGRYEMRFVAFDAKGRAGLQRASSVCVRPAFDDNLNACDPTAPPPRAVLSLSWDTDMDLDLRLRTPSGKLVDAKHPSTAAADAGMPASEVPGLFDHDSNADCELDSLRHESVLWQDEPEAGTYSIYVNVFNACGKAAAHFELSRFERGAGEQEGTYQLIEAAQPVRGEVLGASANGGAQLGTFVTEVEFP
jgi:hypothetical protein